MDLDSLMRVTCVRCDHPIDRSEVNKKQGIYKCLNCHVVASIYEERRFEHVQNFERPPGVKSVQCDESVEIWFDKRLRLPLNSSIAKVIGCLIVLVVIAAVILAKTVSGMQWGFWCAGMMLLLIALFLLNNFKTSRLTLNRQFLQLHSKEIGRLYEVKSISTAMIDQIYVVRAEVRDSELGERTKKYRLELLLKGGDTDIVIPEMPKPELLFYIAKVVEDYVGIQRREISYAYRPHK